MRYLFLFCIHFLSVVAMNPSFSIVFESTDASAKNLWDGGFLDGNHSAILTNLCNVTLRVHRPLSHDAIFSRTVFCSNLLPVEVIAMGIVVRAYQNNGENFSLESIPETELLFLEKVGLNEQGRLDLLRAQKERIKELFGEEDYGIDDDTASQMVSVGAHACVLY